MKRVVRRITTGGILRCLFLSLAVVLIALAGSAAAGTFTVANPSSPLIPGTPTTLSVYLNDADEVAGFQLYITDEVGSTSFMHIRSGSSDIEGMYLNDLENKAVLYADGHEPLSGTVKLFDIDVTPASGKNVQLKFDIVEVLEGDADDVTDATEDYAGIPAFISTSGGKNVEEQVAASSSDDGVKWVYDPANGLTPADPVTPAQWSSSGNQEASSQSSSSGDSAASQATKTPTTSKTKKSPGFLPLTLGAALGIAGILALRSRGGR